MSTTVLWLCLIQTLIWATVHSASPTCNPGNPTAEVNSNEAQDFLLLELDNICADTDNDALAYTISAGNDDGLFKIDGNQVQLAKVIPGQMRYRYVMQIDVDDGTSPTLFLSFTVTIRFNNNLNDPTLSLPSIINLLESTQIGTFITACTVSDADASKGTLSGVSRVGILNPYGALGRKFVLDSVSCELFVNTVLDYENIKSYNLVIEAWDLDPFNPRRVNKTITITIQDDNDNRPTCNAYEILEATTLAATVGEQIFKANCSDVDSGANGQITYSMDASNAATATNLFEVESITGILKVKAAITDTNIPFYEVVINVKDGGSPSKETKVLVRVVVTDASGPEPTTFDRRILYPAIPPAVVPLSTTGRTPPARTDPQIPRCVRNAVTVVMPEDQLANTELYDLACSDPDGLDQDLQYIITKGDTFSSFVVIDGKFRLKKIINGDFTSKRSIHITVTDPTDLSTSVVVAVYITNSNDNDPVIKDLPASIQVREDQPIGTIVNSCSVNEKDSKQSLPPGGQTRVGWINSDPDTQYWFLDSVTCDLYVNTALDYETTQSYTLLIGAWDLDITAPRTVTGTMTVFILDANDNPPICPATYDASVPEDAAIGTVLETVVCTDADSGDNSKVFFKVDDANEAVVKSSFTVDGISGQVTVQAALDFETRTSYDVVIIAYDGGLPMSLSSTSTIRVTVTDVADGGATGQNTSTPDFTFKPTVGITLAGNAPVSYEFLCNFNLDTNPLWYLVNWYVNGNKIYTTPRVSSSADVLDGTKLTEAKMVQIGVTTVGFDISCEFRASFLDDSNLGAKSTSDPKFVGIKVLTKDVTIAQGAEGVIQVQATAPIGCNGVTCDFPLYTFLQKNGYDCAVSQATVPCGVNIDTASYANVYDIRIKGGITFQYGRSGSTSILKLRSAETYADHPMWANYELDDVTVTVTQNTTIIEGSKCAAFVDPRVVTFDKGLLDLQEVGVYTLYSHPPTKSEIQIESYKCDEATGAHCVCGVALRTGRSVFKLDGCGQSFTDIKFSLCDDNHLKVEKLERFYQVYFPTGTRVTIFIRPKNMNVFIYPSVMDINNSGGLCGKLSGNLQDDLVKRDGSTSNEQLIRGLFKDAPDFFESWKVGASETNLFDIEAGVNDGPLTTLDGSTFVYDPADYSCSPIGNSLLGRTGSVTNEACSIFTDVGRIQSDAASVGFTTVARPAECKTNKRRRRRRSVRAQKKPLDLEEEAHFREKRSVWKNGWTSESAATFCNDLFNQSSMVSLCKDLALVDITSSQIACYQDIELTGSANYSLDTMSAIRSQCIHEVSADDSFKVPDVPGQKPIFESILEVVCPGECTQQGQCVGGECQCNEGFGAIDCSVDITDNPLLVTLENEGYCDVRDQDCSQISAFGETFVAGQNMRCKTTYFELISDVQGMVMKDERQHVPYLESISEAVCTFPPLPVRSDPDSSIVAYGYQISLTNDGKAYSDPNYMVIFNSECQTCNISSTGVKCSVQSGYCVSDGQCYKTGSTHMENECYTCQSSQNESSVWAIREDEVCIGVEEEEDEDDMLWIIGVVLGILCAIILAGIVFFLVNRKKNKISLSQTQLNPGPSRKFSKTNLNT